MPRRPPKSFPYFFGLLFQCFFVKYLRFASKCTETMSGHLEESGAYSSVSSSPPRKVHTMDVNTGASNPRGTHAELLCEACSCYRYARDLLLPHSVCSTFVSGRKHAVARLTVVEIDKGGLALRRPMPLVASGRRIRHEHFFPNQRETWRLDQAPKIL